jgi:hypothetical protein
MSATVLPSRTLRANLLRSCFVSFCGSIWGPLEPPLPLKGI